MKLQGFIGPAYTLNSVNVDAQRAVNIYPEIIESGNGKEAQTAYYKSTPGLEQVLTAGDGPIRCMHIDSIGRKWVVSGNKLMRITTQAEREIKIEPVMYGSRFSSVTLNSGSVSLSALTDTFTGYFAESLITGDKVRVSSTGALPAGLLADTDYYVISNDVDELMLASSLANALAGTQVDITNSPTDNFKIESAWPDLTEIEDINAINLTTGVNYTSGVFTSVAHGMWTGLRVWFSHIGCPLPISGATDTTDYFVIKISDDTFKLASSIANASAGTALSLTETSASLVATQINTQQETSSDGSYGRERTLVVFDTSTGLVNAASMTYGGDGTDSSTMYVDGSKTMVFQDNFEDDYSFIQYFDPSGDAAPILIGPAASHVVWIDGYFVVNKINTNKFYVSGLQNFAIDELDFSSSEGSPDIVLGLATTNRLLYVFNELTTEVYYNSGNSDFPFERAQGGFIQMGCLAKHSIKKIGDTIFWLSRNDAGQGSIFLISGTTYKRVSTYAIEQAISGYADASTAVAYSYQYDGHQFYVLNFDEATWVYDLSTGLWHERAYTNRGVLERHRGQMHFYDFASGNHYVSDYDDNNIYLLNETKFTDNGDEITRLRTCPHVSAENRWMFYYKLFLDMETGVGLNGDVDGSEPLVMLSYSDDGGHEWSDELTASIDVNVGSVGDYKKRLVWRRLGKSRDRIFRFKITDPVKVTFINADITFKIGAS